MAAVAPATNPDAALALAMVASSASPLVLLDGGLNLIAASLSFCRAFDLTSPLIPGCSFFALGAGEWDTPQLHSLLKAAIGGRAEIEAYEMDLLRDGRESRRLVIRAEKLDYGEPDHVRLLLEVSDVTDARVAEKLKDDLLREKAIRLQELQHRVANSLQIIASVLLQSARRVQSDESRNHLQDAHSRVMSVAAVQQQLAASRIGEVALRPYFTDLCKSLASSMIHDQDQLSLRVDADDGVTNADTSVSLGLMVTELVINALKHAFPGHRKGEIVVTYRAGEPGWTLSVGDNGVGMPKDAESAMPGLGTGIVAALAKQLKAEVHLTDACPGTTVQIVGEEAAAGLAA